MSDIKDTLASRGPTHGNFMDNAEISRRLKRVLKDAGASLEPYQEEALGMICHKIARIVTGDPKFIDSWRDIAGYAQLVVNLLEKDPSAVDVKVERFNPCPLKQAIR